MLVEWVGNFSKKNSCKTLLRYYIFVRKKMKKSILILVLTLVLGACVAYMFMARDKKQELIIYEDVAPSEVVPLDGGDSLYMFRDTVEGRWSAEVSGSNVELRSLVLVDEFDHRSVGSTAEWDLSLRTGVSSAGSAWYGIGMTRRWDRFSVSIDGGYDSARDAPYMGLSASMVLFSGGK